MALNERGFKDDGSNSASESLDKRKRGQNREGFVTSGTRNVGLDASNCSDSDVDIGRHMPVLRRFSDNSDSCISDASKRDNLVQERRSDVRETAVSSTPDVDGRHRSSPISGAFSAFRDFVQHPFSHGLSYLRHAGSRVDVAADATSTIAYRPSTRPASVVDLMQQPTVNNLGPMTDEWYLIH